MKLSDAIRELTTLYNQHGDLELVRDWSQVSDYEPAQLDLCTMSGSMGASPYSGRPMMHNARYTSADQPCTHVHVIVTADRSR